MKEWRYHCNTGKAARGFVQTLCLALALFHMIFVLVLLFLLPFSLRFISADTVDIPISFRGVNATVRGQARNNGWVFYGVAYAQPPIGDLRFAVSGFKNNLHFFCVNSNCDDFGNHWR